MNRVLSSLALLLRLSLRNLLRHSRRNALMLAAITFAIATVVFMNALVRGMQNDLSESTVNNLTGNLNCSPIGLRSRWPRDQFKILASLWREFQNFRRFDWRCGIRSVRFRFR